jgi:hypothetical protein
MANTFPLACPLGEFPAPSKIVNRHRVVAKKVSISSVTDPPFDPCFALAVIRGRVPAARQTKKGRDMRRDLQTGSTSRRVPC